MLKIKLIFLFLLLNFQFNVFSQTTNEVTFNKGGTDITFYYNCDGGPCETGQFVTGDYWVAPNNPNGTVTITNITPVGNLHGAMVNPDLFRDNVGNVLDPTTQMQGLLNVYDDSYSADLNLMNKLPYEASGGDAIAKITGKTVGCFNSTGCVDSGAILTILSQVPQDRGVNTFRPPFAGTWRPMYTTDKVRMDRLPKLPQANGLLGEPYGTNDGNQSYLKWLVPQVDIYSKGVRGNNDANNKEFMRATIPHAVQKGYAADQANALLEDIFRVFGQDSDDLKKETVYAIIQKGIDNFAIFKQGLGFESGAGQYLGKKPPITFFAALYDDESLLEEVRRIATDPKALSRSAFQADSQVRAGRSGMAIWGEDSYASRDDYFNVLYPALDRQGGYGDPFDYIDGPAGGIYDDENETIDRDYMSVSCAAHIGYAFLQHLMPWYKYAAGDDEILQFADRVYDGYGIDNFDGGKWALPDPLAPRDPIDYNCDPRQDDNEDGTLCNNYGITWGAISEDHPDYDENNLKNNYIAHNQDPNTYGRMPHIHGTKINFTRINVFVGKYWNTLRPCSDPNNTSYPCEGLGPDIDSDLLSILDEIESLPTENIIITNSDKYNLTFKTTASYNTFDIKIYSISGHKIIDAKGSGNQLKINYNNLQTGIYIYNAELDGKTYNGKIGIIK